jgi:hypothetical protein
MSELKNSDVMRGVIEAVVAVAGRRTLGSYTIKIVTTVTKTLQKKYDFLKYITIHNSLYSEDNDIVTVSSEINSIEPEKIGKAVDNILREVYNQLDNEAGLYFINEFKECIGDEHVVKILSLGVDLDRIQSDQHELNNQKERKDFPSESHPREKTDKRKPKEKKPKKDESILDYSWSEVSAWKYNNNVCTLYKSDGSLLDTLHLDSLVEDYVNRYTKYKKSEQTTSKMIEINEKEYELLEILYSRDLDIDMAMVMLHISKPELEVMVNKFLDSEMLQYISDNEVKLTRKGILYLLENMT